MKYKFRFIGGLIMVLASVILMLTNNGARSTVPFSGLAVIGIVLIVTAKKKMRKPPDTQG